MRAKTSKVHNRKRAKTLRLAKGFRGKRKNLYRVAKSAVMKAGLHAYVARRQRKRYFRSLWIVRINAATRRHGMKYAQFIAKLKENNILLNRKTLADLSMNDDKAFANLVEKINKKS